jgi:phosphatidate cytidylyltransferase
MTTTPIHRRIVVVLAVLVVTISCSNLVDAIRLTGDRGLKVSTRVTANTTIRRSNNKALLLLNIRGGDDSVVSVIPDATLPRAIAGMSVPAFQFQQQINDNDNGNGNDNDNNEHVDSYNNSDFDVRGHVQNTTNTNYVSLTHPPPSSVVTSSPPDTTTTTTLQLHHVLRREGGGEDDASADNVAVVAAAEVTVPSPPDLAMKSAKWNGLKTRILSTIGIISSLGGLSYFFKEDGLSVFVVVLQAMMYREMTRTIGGDDWGTSLANVRKYWWFVTAVIAWNGPRLYPWKRGLLEAIAFTMTVSTGLLTTILGFQYNRNGNIEFREYIRQTAVSLFSAALVVLPSSYWIAILEEYGMKWIFFPAAFVAINDIMAYVFGKLFGKHPLLSSISPNKTWEGFIGAAIATSGTAWVTLASAAESSLPIIGPGLDGVTRLDGMVLAIFASLIAPFAGFLASVIKRAYGRKDFGTLLPGHGGVVDRLDCQLILAPFVYFYLSLYKFNRDNVKLPSFIK